MAWKNNPRPKRTGLPVWKQEGNDAVCRDSDSGDELMRKSLELKTRLNVDFFEQFAVKLLKEVWIDEEGDEIISAGATAYAAINPGGEVMLFEYEGSHTCIGCEAKEHVDFEVI